MNTKIRKTTHTLGTTPDRTMNGVTDSFAVDSLISIDYGTENTYGKHNKIEDISLIGVGAVAYAIYAPRTLYLKVSNVYITGFHTGYYTFVTWMSGFENVEVVTCSRGIVYDNDGTGNGGSTSSTFNRVYINECSIVAFSFYGMVYSTLINCAVDSFDMSSNLTITGACYSFIMCKGVSLVNCGSEFSKGQILYSDGSYLNIIGQNAFSVTGFTATLHTRAYIKIVGGRVTIISSVFDPFQTPVDFDNYIISNNAVVLISNSDVPSGGGTYTISDASKLIKTDDLAALNTEKLIDTYNIVEAIANTFTLDVGKHKNFDIMIEDAVAKTFAFSNAPTTDGLIVKFTAYIKCIETVAITFPAGITWETTAPTFTTNTSYEITFTSRDRGATWNATVNGGWPWEYIVLQLYNEAIYDPTGWVEWTDYCGVVVTASSLAFTFGSEWGDTFARIITSLKPNTNYGFLLSVSGNTMTSGVTLITASSSAFGQANIVTPGQSGNIKLTLTTLASISNNRIYLSYSTNTHPGETVTVSQIRVFELPVGSDLETDYATLTADQLNTKYPFIVS